VCVYVCRDLKVKLHLKCLNVTALENKIYQTLLHLQANSAQVFLRTNFSETFLQCIKVIFFMDV